MKLEIKRQIRLGNVSDLNWTLIFDGNERGDSKALLRLCDSYFHTQINPAIYAMFQRFKAQLPEESVFSRSGAMGAWRHCPNELADEVERLLEFASAGIERETSRWNLASSKLAS